MAFTQGEIDNIASAQLDQYIKGKAMSQVIQSRPLYDAMRKAQKTFSGGKGEVKKTVKGAYSTTVTGFTHNDTVGYVNPANLKQVAYGWKEHHGGISLTLTELKHDGISVVDSLNSKSVSQHSERDLHTITGLFEDKLEDMAEGWARSFDALLHGTGVGDAKALAGIQAFVVDDPLTGTLGGLARTNTWWRNRARTTAYATTAADATLGPINTSTAELPLVLSKEMRQLRRFGGRPNLLLAGSAFIEALEAQLYAKGHFTQQGWTVAKSTEIGMADIIYKGLNFIYDPQLDDLGKSKRLYVLDTKHLFPYVMDGEDMKTHAPARPATQYVMYRGVTWTGMLFADQMNCHGVYDIV